MRARSTIIVATIAVAACAPATTPAQTPAPAAAQQPPISNEVQILSAARLGQIADSLPPAATVSRQIARFEGLSNMMGRRDSAGVHERHEAATDIFVVQRGRARLLYGGTADGERVTTPGEWRGGTIRNGKESQIGPGDIVVIPAGVPHQLFPLAGESFYYFVFKVPKPAAR